jgi:hypothetical protein
MKNKRLTKQWYQTAVETTAIRLYLLEKADLLP